MRPEMLFTFYLRCIGNGTPIHRNRYKQRTKTGGGVEKWNMFRCRIYYLNNIFRWNKFFAAQLFATPSFSRINWENTVGNTGRADDNFRAPDRRNFESPLKDRTIPVFEKSASNCAFLSNQFFLLSFLFTTISLKTRLLRDVN